MFVHRAIHCHSRQYSERAKRIDNIYISNATFANLCSLSLRTGMNISKQYETSRGFSAAADFFLGNNNNIIFAFGGDYSAIIITIMMTNFCSEAVILLLVMFRYPCCITSRSNGIGFKTDGF